MGVEQLLCCQLRRVLQNEDDDGNSTFSNHELALELCKEAWQHLPPYLQWCTYLHGIISNSVIMLGKGQQTSSLGVSYHNNSVLESCSVDLQKTC